MKKILSLLLVVTMLVSLFGTMTISANNDGTLTVVAGNIVNGQVEVKVDYTGNPGVAGVSFTLNFDNDVLIPYSYTKGTVLRGSPLSNLDQGGDMAKYEYVTFMWSNPSNVKADGTLLTVVFDVISDGWEETPLEIKYAPGEIADQSFNDVNPAIVNASIRKTYTISYSANGGSGAPGSQVKYYGDELTIPSTIPTKKGYEFLGWSADSEATIADYTPGETFIVKSDCRLYAVWKVKPITISYDTGCDLEYNPKTVVYGDTYGELPTPEREGYTFEGWYLNGSVVTSNSVVRSDINHTLTAKWRLVQFDILFNLNGGQMSISRQTKFYGINAEITDEIPTKSNYTFKGWANTPTSNAVAYNPGDEYTENESLDLYALWVKNIKVSYETGCDLEYTPKTVVYGDTYGELPTPEREGYTFEGWYFEGVKVTADDVMKTEENHALTAKWSIWTYDVTFNLNDGTSSVEKQVKEYNQPLYITDEIPTRADYTFIGWSADSSCKTIDWLPGDEYTENEALTLYAVWELTANMPIITVESNTGRVGGMVDININIENNVGIAGFTFDLCFDNALLTPASVTKGDIISDSLISNIDQGGDMSEYETVTCTWNTISDITASGTLYTVKFKIKENLDDQIIPISLAYKYGNVANQALEDVYIIINQGNVKAINVMMGDVMEDGQINTKDVIKLSQYLAMWNVQMQKSELLAADVVADNVVNSKDAIKLAQYLAKWNVTLD